MIKYEKEELEEKIKYWTQFVFWEKENVVLSYSPIEATKSSCFYVELIIEKQDRLEKMGNE